MSIYREDILGNRSGKYLAVVFDLDGVLIDSEPIHLEAARIVLERHGIYITPEQAVEQTGITIHKFFKKVVNEWGFPGPKEGADWIAEKREIFREMAEADLRPVAGVDAFVRALHGRWKLGLASSSPRPYIDWMLEKFDWSHLFGAVCTIEDVAHPKPDPQTYRVIVERLRVEKGRVLVFEDSPAGIEAAVAVGLDCVGVGTSFSSERLLGAGAKWFIRDFMESEPLAAILSNSLKGR